MLIENISNNTYQLWIILFGSFFLFISVLVIVPLVLVKLPADYFTRKENKGIINNFAFPINLILIFLKNGLGLILIIFGILLLFIPGQGVLTIFSGLMLMNFPGKRNLELFIVRNKTILKTINWLRSKAGKEKIVDIFKN